jgi:hypothetical protein
MPQQTSAVSRDVRAEGNLPEGVEKHSENRYAYRGYDITRQADGTWSLADDHGTLIGFPAKSYEGGVVKSLNLVIQGMLEAARSDCEVRIAVRSEDLAFQRELAASSLPRGVGPWGALVRYSFKGQKPFNN